MTEQAQAPVGRDEVAGWKGLKLDGLDGGAVGKLVGAYADERSGEPQWLLVRLGLFGRPTLVPARDAVEAAGKVWVPYDRDLIRRAPAFDPDGGLSKELELELLRHYETTGPGDRAEALARRADGSETARPLG